MTFEEALKQLREGKKIRSPSFEDDEYLMACYVVIKIGNIEAPLEEDLKIMSIVKMKGDKEHPDMRPKYIFPDKHCTINPKLHIYPQINLLLIMRDDWEIFEEPK